MPQVGARWTTERRVKPQLHVITTEDGNETDNYNHNSTSQETLAAPVGESSQTTIRLNSLVPHELNHESRRSSFNASGLSQHLTAATHNPASPQHYPQHSHNHPPDDLLLSFPDSSSNSDSDDEERPGAYAIRHSGGQDTTEAVRQTSALVVPDWDPTVPLHDREQPSDPAPVILGMHQIPSITATCEIRRQLSFSDEEQRSTGSLESMVSQSSAQLQFQQQQQQQQQQHYHQHHHQQHGNSANRSISLGHCSYMKASGCGAARAGGGAGRLYRKRCCWGLIKWHLVLGSILLGGILFGVLVSNVLRNRNRPNTPESEVYSELGECDYLLSIESRRMRMVSPFVQCRCQGSITIVTPHVEKQTRQLKIEMGYLESVNITSGTWSCDDPSQLSLLWLATTTNQTNVLQKLDKKRLWNRFSLAYLYATLGGPYWLAKTGWISESKVDECDWFGIECSGDGAVLGISLAGNNLTGTITRETLEYLKQFGSSLSLLSFPRNNVAGRLPLDVRLNNLQFMDVAENRLTGSIPERLPASLQELNLTKNRLVGSIESIVMAPQLSQFEIEQNPNINGTIPTSIGFSTRLQVLRLADTKISGTIPSEIGRLTNLREFIMARMPHLTGSIPTELWRLTNLESLVLVGSHNMSGTLATEVGLLTNLVAFDIDNTAQTGTIPTEIGNMRSLFSLRLNDNKLHGTVPSDLGLLSDLRFLFLSGNLDLTGTLPTEVGGLEHLRSLVIANTRISGTMPVGLRTGDRPPTFRLTYPCTMECACRELCTLLEVDVVVPSSQNYNDGNSAVDYSPPK